jgi:hypothetical protein
MSRLKTSTTPITLGMEADYLQFDFHISNISEFFGEETTFIKQPFEVKKEA